MRINLIVINLKGFYALSTVPVIAGLREITGVTQLHILQRLSCEKLEMTASQSRISIRCRVEASHPHPL